jgi:hypothetical protein
VGGLIAIVAQDFACLRIDEVNLPACEASDAFVSIADTYRNFVGAKALHPLACIWATKKERTHIARNEP